MIFVKNMKKNRTHKKPKFTQEPYKVAGVDIITPDDLTQDSASVAKERLLSNQRLATPAQNQPDAPDLTAQSFDDLPIEPSDVAPEAMSEPQSPTLTKTDATQTDVFTQLGSSTMTPNQHPAPEPQIAPQTTQNNDKPQGEPTPSSAEPAVIAGSALPKPFPKTQKSNNKKWLVACIVAVLVGIGLGQCVGKQKAQTVQSTPKTTPNASQTPQDGELVTPTVTERVPVMAVEAVTPQDFIINESLTAEGAIFGGESAMVGAKASGLMVEQVFVKVGDRVKKGQTLAILDDYTAKNEVVALTADKKQAEINLAKVNSDFERIQSLMDIDAISWQQYDQYKAVKMQAEAQLDGINARLNSIQNQVKNTKVVAPVSGVISEKNAEVGMMTGGGSLFGIIKTDKLEWRATLQADKRDKVFVGQKVVLGKKATGKVVRISPTANDKRELTIFVALNGAGVPIGSYQTGEFVLNQKSVLALPAKSVMSYDGKEFVWVLTDKQAPKPDDKTDNNGTTLANLGVYTAKKMSLPNAKRLGDKVAVELPKDTLVIKAGGNFLSEGDLVTLTAIDKKDDESPNDKADTQSANEHLTDNPTNDKANDDLANETSMDENSANDNASNNGASSDNSSDKMENRE